MNIDFGEAFERLLGHEGDFQDDYNDRGNWTSGTVGQGELKGTRWGISAMSYPDEDIENLSQERAKELYYRDFWLRVDGDSLNSAVAYQLFDAAVNHGIETAIRLLQRAVGVADDGDIGTVTRSAIVSKSTDDVLHLFNAERLLFYTKLTGWPTYGKGWVRRVVENMRYGAYDYTAPWYVQTEIE